MWDHIIGDSNVILKLIDDLRDAAQESIEKSVGILGEMVKAETRKAIVNQTPNWKPLSRQHLAYKSKRKYPKKIYLMTKSLYTSLNSEVVKKNSANIAVKVGFPRTQHPLTGAKLSDIAKQMEYGGTIFNNRKLKSSWIHYNTS